MNHYRMVSLLSKALKAQGDFYTLSELLDEIKSGNMQSFTDGNTWVITQVLDYPRTRVLNLFMVVGEMTGVRALSPAIEDYAKSINASRIVAEGRLGWESVFDSFGWIKKPTYNFYKDLA